MVDGKEGGRHKREKTRCGKTEGWRKEDQTRQGGMNDGRRS